MSALYTSLYPIDSRAAETACEAPQRFAALENVAIAHV
jgi:hypothetical protein